MKKFHFTTVCASLLSAASLSVYAQAPEGAPAQPNQAVDPTEQRTTDPAGGAQGSAPMDRDPRPADPMGAAQPDPTHGNTMHSPDANRENAMPIPDANNAGDEIANDDKDFLENAIQGSYAEIEGSQLALEKTEDPKIKEFAQTMIDDHKAMLEETSQLATQKGVTPPDGPSMMQTTEITGLKALTGGAFDTMYINRIGVASHEKTIELFEETSQSTQDSDIKKLVDETLPKLRHHLEMAQAIDAQQEQEE